jgi:agmatine deiminase
VSKRRKIGTAPDELGYRLPAEWEPHAATWLAWPSSVADWPDKGGAIPWVFTELIRHLTESEVVRLIVPSAAAEQRVAALLRKAGADVDEVDFVYARLNRTWARDFMPTLVTRRQPQAPEATPPWTRPPGGKLPLLGAVKWRFNGWARYPNHKLDDAAGDVAARWLDVPTWHPEVAVGKQPHRVVLEGGALDVDGEGTLITTRECLLDGRLARNPKLGKQGTEAVLAQYLGVRKVLWLNRGIAGDDTSGHVDDFVRFVGPGRVVLCHEPNGGDPNHEPLAAAAERLRGARDARGRKLEVVPLPMPAPLHFGRDRLPASYANFYVGNSIVLVPTFNDERDRVALGILQELFPTRKVVGVHCVDLVLGLGTIHCSTMQEPLGLARSAERGRAKPAPSGAAPGARSRRRSRAA